MVRGIGWLSLVFGLEVLGAEVEVSPLGGAPLQKLRIGLEWFMNPDHLPLIVASRLGYFAELGLEVELVEPADHWEAGKEIHAGRLDCAVTETLHLAQDAAAGEPTVGFARFLHTDGGVMVFDEAIQRPRDLCGKTIAYPGAPGPGGPAIAQTMVLADGGACDVASYGRFNGGFDHVGALASGKADAATLIFANFEIPAAKAAGHAGARYFSLKEYGVPDFCVLVLMTTPAVLHGPLAPHLRNLVLGIRKAVGLIHRDPVAAARHYRMYLGVSEGDDPVLEAALAATLPMFPNDNAIAPDYFHHLMRWLIETGQVANATADGSSAVPDPSVYWSNDLALP